MIKIMPSKDSSFNGDIPNIVKAAYDSDADLVARLLVEGDDPNAVDPGDNLSLLHIACMQGDMRLAEVLLNWDKEHGDLDFNVQSHHRPRLAWQYAANANFLDLAARVHDAALAKDRSRRLTLG